MQIRMTIAAGHSARSYASGEVVEDLDDATAENWIAAGIAVPHVPELTAAAVGDAAVERAGEADDEADDEADEREARPRRKRGKRRK